jgi:uncharacterized membrane protein
MQPLQTDDATDPAESAMAEMPDPRKDEQARVVPGHAPGLAWLLLSAGILGALAAFVLTVEKLALLRDATYVPSCSVNPVLNCGSIMRTDQAEVFGFPNPLIGLATFPVLAATGAAILAGARLHRWYWLGLQAGATLGLGFVGWLIFQSLYRIGALCPYCMVVWAVVIPAFWYITLANMTSGRLGVRAQSSRLARAMATNHAVILTMGFLTVLTLIAHRFWDYWSSLLT